MTQVTEYSTLKHKVFLYFDGDHVALERQIRAAIAEVLLSEMMFGNGLRDNLTNTTMINLPEWYLEGLKSFVSNPWDYEMENRVKDGIVSGKYRKFVNLQDDDARHDIISKSQTLYRFLGPSATRGR